MITVREATREISWWMLAGGVSFLILWRVFGG